MNDKWLIYKIVFPNGKHYIGLTKNLVKRKYAHKRDSIKKVHRPVCNAINHFGWSSIKFEIVQEDIDTLEEANDLEQKYILEYNSHVSTKQGYNVTEGGDGCLGISKTPEQIEEFRKLSKRLWDTPEHRAKMEEVASRRKDDYTPEVRAKMSKSAKKRVARLGSNFKPRRIYCSKLDAVFLSLKDCAKYLEVSVSTLHSNINGNTKINKYKSLSYYN